MRVTIRQNVRILLVGDRGVGKTSLILSLVSEEFPEDVPPKAEEITIPADLVPEMVPTHIVDYSSVEQSDDQLLEEVRKAHVICLVYSVEDERTFNRVTSYWLPLLREALPRSKTPIVLVGNKVDLTDDSTIEAAEMIMEKYPEIESFVETSAKTLRNISEMFYYAQKAVLHPTAPVYITEKEDLTDECKKALTRIFRVCDLDNDGLLNDHELNAFQKRCFDMPLKPEAMEDVKAILQSKISGGVSPNNCITLTGFLYLHCLFIRRGRSHTTWTILRKFGYNENLILSKDYLFPPIKVSPGSTSELSHKGQQFFTKLFQKYDKDRDGALSPIETGQMFDVCPKPAWDATEITRIASCNEKGWITLRGFLCFWQLTTLKDVKKTFEYLAYFGFPISDYENQLSAVQITREKKLDLLKKQSTRNIYQCHIIGAKGVGKSSVARGILGHNREATGSTIKDIIQTTINSIQVYGQEKFLMMKEIESKYPSEVLAPAESQCDVVCFVYDSTNPKSFEYCARLYGKHFEDGKTPVLFVCCKSDLTEVRQDYLVQPAAFCDSHRLPPPHKFSSIHLLGAELYQKLATMAAFPHLTELSLYGDSVLWKAGLGVALVTAVGLIVMRLIQTERR